MTNEQAKQLYRSFPQDQTMPEQAFITQAVALTNPNQFHQDARTLLAMRSTAQAERTRIELAMRRQRIHDPWKM